MSNLQIELTATPEGANRTKRDGASGALVSSGQTALVAPHAKPGNRPKRSSWRQRGLWIGLAAAGGIGGWFFYAQPWQASVPAVSVEIVAPGPVTRVLAVNGRIAALRSVAVKSTVAGTLVAALAEEGNTVLRGAVLARLDDTSQQAAVRQATAALDQQLLAEAQAGAALKRTEALAGNVSRVALDDARSAADRAAQEVGRLRALVDQAQFQLTKFSIVAPIAGTILTRGVEPGQVVDLATTLFTLGDLSELVVETDVDESYATQIRTGMPAVLQLTGDDRKLDGTVSFVAPVVEPDTGGLAVKIAFAEAQAAPVGLTVTANIIVDRRDAAISAPRVALVTADAGLSVFVVEGEKAKRVPVEVIDWPADRLIVTDGLKAGDRLITDADNLADGQAVRTAGQ
ncbi:efflux RND transporter periplasmic adaptor subunit [Aquibium carbonis]|uniref:Efflux RND transporter periplasmic adaptor subunit n=2 Tax=Aquibium carbonis TaxID=2495581 RepID=A0A429YHZ4_9HYPH|nr:efflux RND transporter periplasmic adaptor subunit [Aquibium carbonis]